jgi:hypothetical protein
MSTFSDTSKSECSFNEIQYENFMKYPQNINSDDEDVRDNSDMQVCTWTKLGAKQSTLYLVASMTQMLI